MSRVSWQKEAGRSESINFQIGCWSMTADEAAATSNSREGSTLHRPSWHRTSGAPENPRNTQEMPWHGRQTQLKAEVTKAIDLNEVRISEALSLIILNHLLWKNKGKWDMGLGQAAPKGMSSVGRKRDKENRRGAYDWSTVYEVWKCHNETLYFIQLIYTSKIDVLGGGNAEDWSQDLTHAGNLGNHFTSGPHP